MIWLALLTVYQSYVATDALRTLKDVSASQEVTLNYISKSVKVLKKIRAYEKGEKVEESTAAVYHPNAAGASL